MDWSTKGVGERDNLRPAPPYAGLPHHLSHNREDNFWDGGRRSAKGGHGRVSLHDNLNDSQRVATSSCGVTSRERRSTKHTWRSFYDGVDIPPRSPLKTIPAILQHRVEPHVTVQYSTIQ